MGKFVFRLNMSELNHLKRLQIDQIIKASEVTARAFYDDPAFVYCFPDPIERKIKSVTFCEYLILLGMLSGEVYITSSDIEGIAVWHAYNIKDQKIVKQSKEVVRRMRRVKRKNYSDPLFVERYSINAKIINSLHDEYANFPNWELVIIGVDPPLQGKKYGGRLIKEKLRELDKQNLPCYVNTQNEKNVSLYEHFGFELVGKAKVPNSNVYHYGLLRNKKKS